MKKNKNVISKRKARKLLADELTCYMFCNDESHKSMLEEIMLRRLMRLGFVKLCKKLGDNTTYIATRKSKEFKKWLKEKGIGGGEQ